jgi:hypothetical protein
MASQILAKQIAGSFQLEKIHVESMDGALPLRRGAASLGQLICHCRDCQRASGSAGLPVLVVRGTDFSFKGAIRTYTTIGGSGMPTTRNFCPQEIPQHLRRAP